MKKRPISIFRVLSAVSLIFLSPLKADAQSSSPESGHDTLSSRVTSLTNKHKYLQQDTATLLKRLVAERTKILEEMRVQTRQTMEEWENDPNYLNGRGLKAALYNAEAVAEGYGFDVDKLNKMYRLSKKLILGLEMVGKCGEGSPQLKVIGDTIDALSTTAKGAMDFFWSGGHRRRAPRLCSNRKTQSIS